MLVFGSLNAHAVDLDFRQDLTKEQKIWATNIGTGLFITTWGVLFWDYGQNNPKVSHERWFGQNTAEGGADKLAHLYATYAIAHGFSHYYEKWGYDRDSAALYGALSGFGWMSFMEVGDSFSKYGFAYQDVIMNAVGSGLGYVMYKYPQISRKFDLKIEYRPNFKESDIITDYGHMKFLVAAKLDGFDFITNKYLKYADIHLGYFARGYSENRPDKHRNIYVGIGINLSKVFNQISYPRTASFFNYYQPPFTYVSYKSELK
jgi:hypothetical protein